MRTDYGPHPVPIVDNEVGTINFQPDQSNDESIVPTVKATLTIATTGSVGTTGSTSTGAGTGTGSAGGGGRVRQPADGPTRG